MRGSDGTNVVLFVDDYRHVVGEARREERQEKNRKHGKALEFHRHIHGEQFCHDNMTSLPENCVPSGQNIVKLRRGT
jgi:hypothetical protein